LCEKTFSASFVPQPAENNTFYVNFKSFLSKHIYVWEIGHFVIKVIFLGDFSFVKIFLKIIVLP
jgi:hypothetical protein